MDALILSCGTGGGHDSAARAILEQMEKRGHHAVMCNPYGLKSDRLENGINNLYISAARDFPRGFGTAYRLGDLYRRLPFRSPVYFVNHGMNTVLQEYLSGNHFDVVLMTHLFPAEILTNMKQHGISVPAAIFVATDYVCTPFTEETECDAYVIPAADLADDFAGRGLPREKLYPLGIPVSGKFAEKEARETVRQRLGLELDRKYVLITGGSMGGGKIEKTIAKLQSHFAKYADTSLIIVCGSNQALFDRLSRQANAQTTLVGYTKNMADYLKACDLFITKPGGLSSTEAAVCGTPIFHTSPIPGCETYNARYFSGRGMSISGEINDETLAASDAILADERVRAEMIACQRAHTNPMAASEICELVERMAARG